MDAGTRANILERWKFGSVRAVVSADVKLDDARLIPDYNFNPGTRGEKATSRPSALRDFKILPCRAVN